MENDKKLVSKPRRSYPAIMHILALGLVTFVNCFGFPVYNWNKEWPLALTALYLFLTPCYAAAAGAFLAKLFPGKGLRYIVILTGALASVGLACRFFLEFGEVSNTYNFTLPNILFHLAVFLGVLLLSWYRAVKQEQAEGSLS